MTWLLVIALIALALLLRPKPENYVLDQEIWQQKRLWQQQGLLNRIPEGQYPLGDHHWMRYANSRPEFSSTWLQRFQLIALASTLTGKLTLIAEAKALQPPKHAYYYLIYLELSLRLRAQEKGAKIDKLFSRLADFNQENNKFLADFYFLQAQSAFQEHNYEQALFLSQQAFIKDPIFFQALMLAWKSAYLSLPDLKQNSACLAASENLLSIMHQLIPLTSDPLIFSQLAHRLEGLPYEPIQALLLAYLYQLAGEKKTSADYLQQAVINQDLPRGCYENFAKAMQWSLLP